MSSPSVSILVPAFRPDWLDVAVASALAQTHGDFELLVSDDSAGQEIASVMAKWDDPRIRYFRNPRRTEPGGNRNHLLAQARGEYIKFLFDDDFLLPRSVELLLRAARETGAQLAFHSRHFVDQHGRQLNSPQAVPAGQTVVLSQAQFFEQFLGACMNLIGEPTNILLHARTLREMDQPFSLDGHRMRFLTDVALYTNFFARAHRVVGIGYFGSAFRQHGGQASGKSPGLSAGYFEWELLRRWSVDAGLLDAQVYHRTVPTLQALYQQRLEDFPELAAFVALQGRAEAGTYLSPAFHEAMSLAYTTIECRKLLAAAA